MTTDEPDETVTNVAVRHEVDGTYLLTMSVPDDTSEIQAPMICGACDEVFGSGFFVDLTDPPWTMSGTRRCPKCGGIAAFPDRLTLQTTKGEVVIETEGYASYDLSDLNRAAVHRLAELAQGVIDGTTTSDELLAHLDTGPKPLRRLRSRFPKTAEGRIALAGLVLVFAGQIQTQINQQNTPPTSPELVRILDELVNDQKALHQAQQLGDDQHGHQQQDPTSGKP